MKVLVVGSGGREHALAWKIAASRMVDRLWCAPGNAGTADIGENVPISAEDIAGLVEFAVRERVDLVVIGPEDALCAGLVDSLEERGIRAFGPSQAAARIEGDKAFAKRLMMHAGVPTAEARIFEESDSERRLRAALGGGDFGPLLAAYEKVREEGGDVIAAMTAVLSDSGRTLPPDLVRERVRELEERAGQHLRRQGVVSAYERAREYIASRDVGLVVKAAGLAKGKGVIVCDDPAEALLAIERVMVWREFGAAGRTVLVEERLHGQEASVLAFVDGRNIYLMESAQDHKPIGDGDTGPNTGGMGAYSPTPIMTDEILRQVEREVFVPIIDALSREGCVYRGVLYAGLMLTHAGPRVLEFNCRLGDPETQPILFRLRSDLVEVIQAALQERLDQVTLDWDPRPALCVVIASEGYPGTYRTGLEISGLPEAESLPDVKVFHAGTRRAGDRVVTAGGRVLGVTARGATLADAQRRAYEAVARIRFEGAYFRRDIGARVLVAPSPAKAGSA